MDHPITKNAKVPGLPIRQKSQSLPELPSLPAHRQLQLSDMIIPSSRIELVETLGEGNYVASWCYWTLAA